MASKPKITMQNTKKEMLAAYQEVLEQLKEKRAAVLKPEEQIAEKRVKEAVEMTDTLSTEGIVQEVSTLRLETGRLLSQLSDSLEEEVSRYRQVRAAIQAKEQELQEIYEIERSALSLAALLEAQHQKREQMETDLASRKDELTREIETLHAEWKLEKESHATEIAQRDAEEQKRRKREQEEHEYVFQREQQLTREQFEDDKARLERDIANRREQMEKELAEREQAIAGREQELAELRARVEAFPAEMESAVAGAAKDATRQAESLAKSREELLRKEFDGERNVLNTRIDSLEKTVAEQNGQIARLSQQVEKAYSQVQDIATKAIGSSKPAPGWVPVAAEPPRKPAQEV